MKTRELARDKVKSSLKSITCDCDLCVLEKNFNIEERRYVGRKVEYLWRGPGVIIEVKSDSMYIVKSRREQKVMHHDKLKLCESRRMNTKKSF